MLARLLKRVNVEKHEEQVPFFNHFFAFLKENHIADTGCRCDHHSYQRHNLNMVKQNHQSSRPKPRHHKNLGVEAYWDKNLENKTETIDWSTIWLGTSKNVTLYIRSISNIETTLKLKTANWTFRDSNNKIVAEPSNSSPYINLTWNYNETTVRPDETVQVTLSLCVDHSTDFSEFLIANDVKEFSFDIIISTSEQTG